MNPALMCKFCIITNMISLSLGHFLSYHSCIVKKVAKWQANHVCNNTKFAHQNWSHKSCDWQSLTSIYIINYLKCIVILITSYISHRSSRWLWLATTLSAVCLHMIVNSCMKWLILKRPWPIPDIRPLLVGCTGQTNIKHQMVLPT